MPKTLEDMAYDHYENPRIPRVTPHYCAICGKRMSPRPLNNDGEEICYSCEEEEEDI